MLDPSPAFDRLISPVDTQNFFGEYWERGPLHVRREAADYYDYALTAAGVDRYLQMQQMSPDYLAVLKGGEFCPAEQWTQTFQRRSNITTERLVDVRKLLTLFSSGATVVINSGEMGIQSLIGLSRSLEHELKCPVQANIYITPPQKQGFPPHFDSHNVFILQIHGRKSWNLYDSPVTFPVRTSSVEEFRYHERAPQQVIELLPGDLLYVPRGMVHSARSGDRSSIHVTVGPMIRHWSSLLNLLAKEADEDENFRRLLPHGLSSPQERSEFGAQFTRHLQQLVARTDFPAIHYADFVTKQRSRHPSPFTDLLRLEELTPNSIICRRPELNYLVEHRDGWIHICFEGEELVLPLFLEVAVLRLFEERPFAVCEIEGIANASGKVALVKRFVRAGFLNIVSV